MTLSLTHGFRIGTIEIKEYTEIEFDITINSLCENPTGDWGPNEMCSVLHIGTYYYSTRYPLLFIANRNPGNSQNRWYTRLTTGISSLDGCCGTQINFIDDVYEPLTAVGTHHVYVEMRPDVYAVNIDGIEKILEFIPNRSSPNSRLPLYLPSPQERPANASLSNVCIRSSSQSSYSMFI